MHSLALRLRRLLAAGMLAAGLGACVAGGTAAAQGLLPTAGVDMRVGDLRGYFAQAFGNVAPPEAGTHAWTFSGALDVSETYDTGVTLPSTSGGRLGHDLITRIAPSAGVSVDSSRITGSLFYTPTADLYVHNADENNIDQNLNAAATVEVIPDLFFIDLRGYASEQSITGYNGPTGTTVLSRSDEVQTTTFSVAPTLRHQFGGIATAELGYSATRSTVSTGGTATTPAALQALNQTTITQEEHAVVGTGEDFGRFNDSFAANAAQSSGTGLETSTHSDSIGDTASYAISHAIIVTGSIGHEDIVYGGPTPYTIDDLTWSGGLRLAPNADSTVDLGYGHQQGANSFYLDATYAVTASTRVYATYSQSVGTNVQNLQNTVAATTVGPTGVTVNSTTNAPTVVTNNFYGLRPGLFRTTQGSISGVLLWPKDLFNVTVGTNQSSQLESGVAGSTVNNSSTGTFGSAAWAHDFSDDLHSNALVQYGVNSGAGFANKTQSSIVLNLGLSYSVSDTLSVSAQYTHTTEPTTIGTGTVTMAREIAVIDVHKAF